MPLVSLVIVASLGLGIGANTTVFSWLQMVRWKPLPGVADAGRLQTIETRTDQGAYVGTSWLRFLDLQRQQRFVRVAAGVASGAAHGRRRAGGRTRHGAVRLRQLLRGAGAASRRRTAAVAGRRRGAGPPAGRRHLARLLADALRRGAHRRRLDDPRERPGAGDRRRGAAALPGHDAGAGLRHVDAGDDGRHPDRGLARARRSIAGRLRGPGPPASRQHARGGWRRARRRRARAGPRLSGDRRRARQRAARLQRSAARPAADDQRRARPAADADAAGAGRGLRQRRQPAAGAGQRPAARLRRPPGARGTPPPRRLAGAARGAAALGGRHRHRAAARAVGHAGRPRRRDLRSAADPLPDRDRRRRPRRGVCSWRALRPRRRGDAGVAALPPGSAGHAAPGDPQPIAQRRARGADGTAGRARAARAGRRRPVLPAVPGRTRPRPRLPRRGCAARRLRSRRARRDAGRQPRLRLAAGPRAARRARRRIRGARMVGAARHPRPALAGLCSRRPRRHRHARRGAVQHRDRRLPRDDGHPARRRCRLRRSPGRRGAAAGHRQPGLRVALRAGRHGGRPPDRVARRRARHRRRGPHVHLRRVRRGADAAGAVFLSGSPARRRRDRICGRAPAPSWR